VGVCLSVLLLTSLGIFAGSHEQIASETDLAPDLFNELTVDVNGTELALFIVAINERVFSSKISTALQENLRHYVGKNALYVNPTVEQVVNSFPFFPEQFTVEQEGGSSFTPTRSDWVEITPGFLGGQFEINPGGSSYGSGSEGILVMGDRIDITRPFWVSYQGVRVRFDVSQQTAYYPAPAPPTSTTTPSHPAVEISPLESITDLQQALTEGDFSAEAIASLLLLPQDLVGTLVIEGRGEELRLLFVRLEEGIYDSALGDDLLSSLEPLVGTGAVMVWALSQTGSAFIPWNFYIQQSGTNYVFFSAGSFIGLTEGFLHSGRVEPGAIAAGVIRLPGGVTTNAPFSIHYGTAGAIFGGAAGE
jgi:hypothetical protein